MAYSGNGSSYTTSSDDGTYSSDTGFHCRVEIHGSQIIHQCLEAESIFWDGNYIYPRESLLIDVQSLKPSVSRWSADTGWKDIVHDAPSFKFYHILLADDQLIRDVIWFYREPPGENIWLESYVGYDMNKTSRILG